MNMKIPRTIKTILLASLIATVSAFISIRPVGAIGNTHVYVLGVFNVQDPLIIDLQNLTSSLTILASVSGLSLVGGNSILFVDGSWLASASSLDPTVLSLVAAEPLAGVPTVTVRGNPTLLSSYISGILQWHEPSLPLISEGLKIAGSLSSGTKMSSMLSIVSGFDYAVQTEFNWANNLIAQGPLALTPALSRSSGSKTVTTSANTTTAQPYWEQTTYDSYDTGNYYAPYGRIMTTITAYNLENSNSSGYIWFNVFFNQTIQPGIMIYNSPWRTSNQYSLVHDQNTTTTLIVSHGPANVYNAGPFVVSYNIGVTAGVLNATVTSTQTMSYSMKHTNVTDTSQYPDVSWLHTINARTTAGTLTFQIVPGFTFRLYSSRYAALQLGIATTFIRLQGNTQTGSNTVTFGLLPG